MQLSVDEIEKISKLIQYYTDEEEVNHFPLLEQWWQNKQRLYNFLNQNLIIKFPLDIAIGFNQKNYAIRTFRQAVSFKGGKEYADIVHNLDYDSLVTNKLQEDRNIKGRIFKKGIKISKVLKQCSLDENIQEAVVNEYSKFVQMLYTSGNLCISIHPLDFLSMSDNNCNWTSCHSYKGDFPGGMLSFLTDETSFLCYIEHDNPFYINTVQVNNKRWRQILHLHPLENIVVFNLEYPFEHPVLANIICNEIEKMFNQPSFLHEIPTVKMEDFIINYNIDLEDPLHYNDLLTLLPSGKYVIPYLKVLTTYETEHFVPQSPIIVGCPAICPVCGIYNVSSHGVKCKNCDPLEICCTCVRAYPPEEIHIIRGEQYCSSCFDEEFVYCDYCDELVTNYAARLGLHKCDLVIV